MDHVAALAQTNTKCEKLQVAWVTPTENIGEKNT